MLTSSSDGFNLRGSYCARTHDRRYSDSQVLAIMIKLASSGYSYLAEVTNHALALDFTQS